MLLPQPPSQVPHQNLHRPPPHLLGLAAHRCACCGGCLPGGLAARTKCKNSDYAYCKATAACVSDTAWVPFFFFFQCRTAGTHSYTATEGTLCQLAAGTSFSQNAVLLVNYKMVPRHCVACVPYTPYFTLAQKKSKSMQMTSMESQVCRFNNSHANEGCHIEHDNFFVRLLPLHSGLCSSLNSIHVWHV